MEQEKKRKDAVPEYRLKTPKGIEEAVVGTYKKIEHGVVGAYQKIEERFVDTFLERVEVQEAPLENKKH